jgi:hypothetical protein
MKMRLYADFNSRTEDGKVIIKILGDPDHVKQVTQKLTNGMKVMLHDEELEVEARLEFDSRFDIWVGIPDWSTKHYFA